MSETEASTQAVVEEKSVSTTSTSTPSNAGPQTLLEALQNNPFYHHAQRITLWKDPIESGLTFAILTFFFYLITCGGYTVVTLVSYLLLAFLISAAAYVNGTQFYGQFRGHQVENPLITKFKSYHFAISRKDLEPHLLVAEIIINDALSAVTRALLVTDLKYTLKFAFGAWVASFIGHWSIATLLYLAIVAVFVWPRLYQEKRKEIDQVALLIRQKLSFHLKQLIEKLPPAIKSKIE